MDPDVPLIAVSYTHLRAHETRGNLVCRLLLEKKIGDLRSACFSPHFKKVIGIAMISEPFCKVSQTVYLNIDGKKVSGKVCDLPFI